MLDEQVEAFAGVALGDGEGFNGHEKDQVRAGVEIAISARKMARPATGL
jgi:hypothetical protein